MITKLPFCGNLKEKAYLIGLRTGDIHARKPHRLIYAETTSTKTSQLMMFMNCFEKYT